MFRFPTRKFGNTERSSRAEWCEDYPWLHYYVKLDAAFCYLCVNTLPRETSCGVGEAVSNAYKDSNAYRKRLLTEECFLLFFKTFTFLLGRVFLSEEAKLKLTVTTLKLLLLQTFDIPD